MIDQAAKMQRRAVADQEKRRIYNGLSAFSGLLDGPARMPERGRTGCRRFRAVRGCGIRG